MCFLRWFDSTLVFEPIINDTNVETDKPV